MSGGGFTSGADVPATTQAVVLGAVVDRIRAEVSEFSNESTCFVADAPWPSVEVHSDLFCTVAPGDGTFDPEMPVGAGELGIREHLTVRVTVWSRLMLDRLEQAELQFADSARGLSTLKHKLLKALAGRQLFTDADETVQLLTEHLRPTRSRHPPGKQHEDDYSTFGLELEAVFDWNLTE